MRPEQCPIVVVIATAGRPKLFERALRSIRECSLPPRYAGMLVVENGPKSGVESIVQLRAGPLRARYLYSGAPNKSRALNVALEHTHGNELVIFTDDDVQVRKSWLEAYAEASDGVTRGGMYGGSFTAEYERPPPQWLRAYLPPSAKGRSAEQMRPAPGHFTRLNGINWAAYAEDLVVVGGSDEDRGPGARAIGQETEWQRRLWRHGVWQRLVPDAEVSHFVPAERCSPDWVLQRHYRHGFAEGLSVKRKHRESNGNKTLQIKMAALEETVRALLAEASLAASDEGWAFEVYRKMYWQSGMLAGLRGDNSNPPPAPEAFRCTGEF